MENVASRFGQRLAHTEKKYRDQALKKLTTYLSTRSQWSALEWDKLWKALFYCMWMSDKRAVQDELSTNLAALVHRVPQVDDALGFVHSFFRTMHREWHGIDGLRLDKFYALIRKFVHQTLLLLRNHEWDRALVERVVSILSSEVMSQLPNGLRLHTTDLFLTELHGAAGDDVDTETFLLLLEPFFTLLSSEYDKTVFKRVRELVFLPMLSTYKFGPQPAAKSKKAKRDSDENETDGEDEDEEEEPKVFSEVELPFVQHRIFAIASADDTAERNRSVLYELYSHFFKVTKIDSLKANQDSSLKPKPKSKKRKQAETEAPEAEAETDESSKKKKKNKRRKKNKQGEDDSGDAAMDEPEPETPVAEVVTPEKKSKKDKKAKQEDAATPVNTPVKSAVDETPTKKQKKAKAAADAVVAEAAKALETATLESSKKTKKDKKKKTEEKVDVEMEEPVVAEEKKAKKDKKKKEENVEVAVAVEETEPKKSKKDKKDKKKAEDEAKKQIEAEVAAALEAAAQAKLLKKEKKEKKEVVEEKKAKKTEEAAKESKPEVVVRSGMKFRRCGGCGGIGKGLVPAGKDFCRHCERTGQQKKKALAADKKKRKAEALAAQEDDDESSAPSKKVTFGKNRALAHELSVKRLKASKAVVKELTSDIKGVLKAGSSPVAASKTKPKKTGGRMKAADFF